MLLSPDLIALQEQLLRNNDHGAVADKQRRILPPFEATECLMKHTRNNLDPIECGQQETEAGKTQKLSQLFKVSVANERYSGSLVSLAEAILARSDGFYQTADHDLENIIVCNMHAEEFGREWYRKLPGTSRQGQRLLTYKFPSIPGAPEPHSSTTQARTNTFVSNEESEALLTLKNVLPAGVRPTQYNKNKLNLIVIALCQTHKDYLVAVLEEYTVATFRKLEEVMQDLFYCL